jgi:hypothetical protein
MLKGLGGGIIALILGIAAYKIVMAAMHAIDQGITVLIMVICSAAGAAVALGMVWVMVEVRHRHKLYSTQIRAREALIYKLESSQINATFDAVPQINAILATGRKAVEPVTEVIAIEPAEDVKELEAPTPPELRNDWRESLDQMDELKAEAWIAKHGDR